MSELIRPAVAADAERIVDIWAAGWRDGHLADAPPELLAHRTREAFVPRVAAALDRTRVAEIDGAIAGFTMLHGDEVDQVYVDAAFRGSGVASRLLRDAAEQVRADGHAVPWLAVAVGNARARRFYEREGWTDAGGFSYDAEIGEGGSLPFPCRRMELREGA
ncbi:GNAT family N-acetyltransferase [Protaetiibacter mangrovi]|uniref:GNAT family N-acetyltransferase n=1 Tax=Protaetiibacter mangrovi TaxID=2970926 RepID=A0ABT1ZID1_9MICO|nr:GNAT family N-acetyltransferase [Protaetiibacter mangrovi]MCS0500451.1 GNAT family N-acetyltransferase [Protaetiibacter mangrovi]TPX03734.1 GNAT family N-acetyltransferase [Schumannella luteola]